MTDSGVGIAEAELPSVFDRFHRVKGANSRTHEGTGIGLALVQELIHAHGGTVRVESQEGKGSIFTVTVKGGHAHLAADQLGAQRSHSSTATRAASYVGEALSWVSGGSAPATPISPPSKRLAPGNYSIGRRSQAMPRPKSLVGG